MVLDIFTLVEGFWFIIPAFAANGLAPLARLKANKHRIDGGRLLGGKPLFGPGKTWEGFIGGIILSMIVASLFAMFSGIMEIGIALLFGLMVAVVGQLGDLLESMLKRDANSKESARLIPEFGGVLDLLDSVVVAAPFAYLILVCTTR